MKKYVELSILGIIILTVAGCNQEANPKKKVERVVREECLMATYDGDTATMKISYLDSAKVKGKLKISYANHHLNNGSFDGSFRGDTLFVDYRFYTANLNMGGFTNPLVFLKKGGNLTMGIAQIETTLGRSYFVKRQPINFDRAKFIFEKTSCK